jgi:hypothetical protein
MTETRDVAAGKKPIEIGAKVEDHAGPESIS